MARVFAAALVLVGLLAGCARSGSTAVPQIPADALPGHPTALRSLDANDLAAEALDPQAAHAELDRSGFVAASARTFAAPDRGVRTAQARRLAFGSSVDAGVYLQWLRGAIDSIVGDGRVVERGLPGPGFVFLHEPGGCCPKEQPVAIAVWRERAEVLWVQATGDVGARDAVRYALALDVAV